MSSVSEVELPTAEEVDLINHDTNNAPKNIGTIGTSDFAIWTIYPAIGILFCFLHTEQEHIWTWTGATAAESQSLKSKAIVSIISTVIGGCFVATLMKTVDCVSFTIIKYQGVDFSQLVAVIGGYAPSHIPMLFVGKRWASMVLILFVLVVSAVTKQLAVVSMGVQLVSSYSNMSSSTRDYKTCFGTIDGRELQTVLPVLALDAFNSIRNQNATYTNEYYDRSIPEGIRGKSEYKRELPFANVSCIAVERFSLQRYVPTMFYVLRQSYTEGYTQSAWSGVMSFLLDDSSGSFNTSQAVNCSINLGHATALTTCNNTLCNTNRISSISTYQENGYGFVEFINRMTLMGTAGASDTRNQFMSWLEGASLTTYIDTPDKIPGESLQVVQDRVEILSTVIARILCDHNNNQPYNDSVTFESQFISSEYYVYHVLWKWPFMLIAALIFVSWIICMVLLWITPESRIISVEWLLSQYITRNRFGYLGGTDLVKEHQDLVLQVVDKNSNDRVGNIAIVQSKSYQKIRNQMVLHNKEYQ